MKRQILVFTPPSERGADHVLAQARAIAPSSELGRWLTQELRPKGAPKPSRPPAPIVLPAPDEPDPAQVEFARWLTSDLRPRGSSAPPPDSLAPQVWPELEGPRITPVPELDEDDLSVLPGRPKAIALFGSPRARRAVAAAGLLLLAFGFLLMRGPDNVPGSAESAAAAEVDGAGTPAVLLPPPPDLVPIEPEESAVDDEAPPVPRRRVAEGPEPADAVELATPNDPRSRLGGPSVARFPDLPPPKLSELARDGEQAASERDAAARKAAQLTSP